MSDWDVFAVNVLSREETEYGIIRSMLRILLLVCALTLLIPSGFAAKKKPPDDGCKREFETLERYVRVDWLAYVDYLGRAGTEGLPFFENLVPVLREASPGLKKAIEKKVIERYPTAPKVGDFGVITYFPPRRTLDAILSILWDPRERFRRLTKEGDPLPALKDYFRTTQRAFKDLPNAKYSADDVMRVMHAIQNALADHHIAPKVHVEVFGSFPNGRAILGTSDLDVRVTPASAEPTVVPLLQVAVDTAMASAHSGASLTVNPIQKGRGQPLALYATCNPVTVDINSERSLFEVYRVDPVSVGYFGPEGSWDNPDVYPVPK